MSVIDEIASERRRQIEVEGWTDEHDDGHSSGELALAGAAYAFLACLVPSEREAQSRSLYGLNRGFHSLLVDLWPGCWDLHWCKPKDQRHDLIHACALIVAEIERLDRAAVVGPPV